MEGSGDVSLCLWRPTDVDQSARIIVPGTECVLIVVQGRHETEVVNPVHLPNLRVAWQARRAAGLPVPRRTAINFGPILAIK